MLFKKRKSDLGMVGYTSDLTTDIRKIDDIIKHIKGISDMSSRIERIDQYLEYIFESQIYFRKVSYMKQREKTKAGPEPGAMDTIDPSAPPGETVEKQAKEDIYEQEQEEGKEAGDDP